MNAGKAVILALVTGIVASVGTFYALQAVGQQKRTALAPAPSLKGLTLEQARQLLEAKDLRLVIFERRVDAAQPPGKVVKQVPLEGSRVPVQSPIYVIVSRGASATPLSPAGSGTRPTAPVVKRPAVGNPAVVAPAAKPGIAKPGIAKPGIAKPGIAKPGIAKPGAPGATTEALVTVPRVTYGSALRAKKLLAKAGLKLGRRRTISDEDKRSGVVLRQRPRAGKKVAAGSAVNIWVNDTD